MGGIAGGLGKLMLLIQTVQLTGHTCLETVPCDPSPHRSLPDPAGAVVLGVLAFLAFRPGKGWLRKQARPSSAHDHSSPEVPHGTVDSLPHDDSKLAMDNSMDIHLKEDFSRGSDLEAGAEPPHTIDSVRPHSPPSSRNDR